MPLNRKTLTYPSGPSTSHSPTTKTLSYLHGQPTSNTSAPLLVFVHGWPALGLIWKTHLEHFLRLGFEVAAPDMPGYGGSTSRREKRDYCLQELHWGLLKLLEELGHEKAVWIGHDWGAPCVWSFAAHHPAKTLGVAGLAVPYRSLELGVDHLIRTVNREVYPEDKFPYGQWSYQVFYEREFAKATAWFEADVLAFVKAGFTKAAREDKKAKFGGPAITAQVVEQGGWFGGIERPDPKWREIPIEWLVVDREYVDAAVEGLERNGFWGPDAWYLNHDVNAEYTAQAEIGAEGVLDLPALFVEAKYDNICSVIQSPELGAEMRAKCTNLTQTVHETGHWVAEEDPEGVSKSIEKWLAEKLPETFAKAKA